MRALKGPTRPVICQAQRLEERWPIRRCRLCVALRGRREHGGAAVRPDVLVKGAEYTGTEVRGEAFVAGYGGVLRFAGMAPGYGPTEIYAGASERRAESGERRAESGGRRAEGGERRAESGGRRAGRAESGERRAESGGGERRAEGGERRAESGSRVGRVERVPPFSED